MVWNMVRRQHRFCAPLAASIAATIVALIAALSAAVPPAGAAPADDCGRQYLYVHDMAGTAAEMTAFARTIGTPAHCTVIADYGRTRLTDAVVGADGPRVAGFAAIDESAGQIVELLRAEQRPESRDWVVIAQGAGGLVAQRALQERLRQPTAGQVPISAIVTVGPMWRGTNIGFLGDTEDISRRLGTYDAVLRLEKPLIDPWCAGCRELVRGSELLQALHRDGLPTRGVSYTNVISPIDGLVSEPLSAALSGMDNRVLKSESIRRAAHHFALLSDPAVATLVRDALGGVAHR